MGADGGGAAQRRQEHRKRHHLRHGLRPEDVQPAEADQQVQRQAPGSHLELQPGKRHGRALAADDLQRRHVRGQRQLDLRHRRRDRQADLAHAGAVRAWGAARRDQRSAHARPGDDLRGQALSPDGRCARARSRHEDRQGDLEAEVRRVEGRLQGRHRAPHRRRSIDLGDGGRGQHHARLRRRLRSGYGEAIVAQVHDSRARRAGFRDLAEPDQTGRVEVRRRSDLAVRLVRSAARPRVYRHRECRAVQPDLSRRRRLPVYRQHSRAQAEDRRNGLVLPVRSERQLRLRRDARCARC